MRTFVRYYADSWEIQGLTANVDVPIYVYKGLSVSPTYRFYYQVKSKYYADYGQHEFRQGSYYTSDYDLAGFTSQKVGMSMKYSPLNGIFNIQNSTKEKSYFSLRSAGVRYSYYMRTDDFKAGSVTFELNFEL